jgi:sugar phosphate isomerase/epimerase
VSSLLEELDLQVHAIHAPYSGLRLGHPNAGLKKDWLETTAMSLEIGVQLGAKIAVVHLTSDPEGLTADVYEESKKISIEYIEELRQHASELGIRLALENLLLRHGVRRRFGTSLKEMSKAFPSEDIGFCLDIGHVAINGLNLRSEIEAAGKRLISMHVANNDGVKDRHWLPTHGMLDWEEVKSELARSGYVGRYVLEVLRNPRDDDPDTVLRQTVEFAKRDADRPPQPDEDGLWGSAE